MTEETHSNIYDVLIIGGGIVGCSVARDAAGRGFKVLLCEKSDLASGASSNLGNVLAAGIEYGERFNLRAGRQKLEEIETIISIAPHLAKPMRIVVTDKKELRAGWMSWASIFAFDHNGGRKTLPPSSLISLRTHRASDVIKDAGDFAFESSACWIDSARLVMLNAIDATEKGAQILTRTEFISAENQDNFWNVKLKDTVGGKQGTITARAIVNATGVDADEVENRCLGQETPERAEKRKLSHIVVKNQFDHDLGLSVEKDDGTRIFAIPIEDEFTLIGPTDRAAKETAIDEDEGLSALESLCVEASALMKKPISPSNVLHTFEAYRFASKVDATHSTKTKPEFALNVSGRKGKPVLITIKESELDSFRKLADETVQKLSKRLRKETKSWTESAKLSGGDFDLLNKKEFTERLRGEFSFLSEEWADRLVSNYGTHVHKILGRARSAADLGFFFGANLYAKEVDYLIAHEWARTANDILWRRTKLGLRLTQTQKDRLAHYVRNVHAGV